LRALARGGRGPGRHGERTRARRRDTRGDRVRRARAAARERLGAREGLPLDEDGAGGRGPRRFGGGSLMLFHLLVPLADRFSALNVFRYITFRTAAATLTAMFLALVAGPAVIRRLQALRVGQPIREIGPDHQSKAGTPTLGGLLILVALVISVLLWADLTNRAIWTVLGLTLGYGALGFVDDYQKVRYRNHKGISARTKLFWQWLLAFGVAALIYTDPSFDGELQVPFFKTFTPHIGWLYVPLAPFGIVAMSNGVNLTDGLDGLAIGPVMISSGVFLVLSYAAGHATIAEYLAIKSVP